jgi:drug/metabolite transporter (DMT)-like permease
MKLSNPGKGYLMIGIASFLWGTAGLLLDGLFKSGVTSANIVFWKLLFGFILMFIYIFLKDRELLKIDKKSMLQLAFVGLVCQALYNLLMFSSVEKTTLATATVLLYTAPAFVIILSKILYKEIISINKIISLFLCMAGCFLVVTGAEMTSLKVNPIGVLMGIGAGFAYAIMTIMSKSLLKSCKQETIVLYAMGFGSLFSSFFSNPMFMLKANFGMEVWLYLFLFGLVQTFLAYTIYITGLSYEVEASKVGIIATLEVVVAATISYIFFNEVIGGWKLFGVLMVIASIVILQLRKMSSVKTEVSNTFQSN